MVLVVSGLATVAGPAAVYENPAKIFDEDVLDSRQGVHRNLTRTQST